MVPIHSPLTELVAEPSLVRFGLREQARPLLGDVVPDIIRATGNQVIVFSSPLQPFRYLTEIAHAARTHVLAAPLVAYILYFFAIISPMAEAEMK